uniref:POU domain protein n=1 Tax=Strongyloides papillosus TaxID=174720 RepID=A0A0N5C1D9_STREA
MSDVASCPEKICEGGEYYNEVIGTQDLCETPNQGNISPTTECTPSHFSSFCSSGFGDLDSTTTFANLPLTYAGNSYGAWSLSTDTNQTNFNNYGYCNYIQEIDNNTGVYQNYYTQGYHYNTPSINNYTDVPMTYVTETYEERSQTTTFQATTLESSQILENTCNQITEYHREDSQIEELSGYDQRYNTPQYHMLEKEDCNSKNFTTKEQYYDFNYSQEMMEVIEFFRFNKKSIFEKSIQGIDCNYDSNNDNSNDNIGNCVSVNDLVGDDQEDVGCPPLKVQKMDTEDKSMVEGATTTNLQIPFPQELTKKFQNEMIVESIEVFAASFKNQRISYGFTQGDVGRHIGLRFGNEFSQTTISRFEALNLSCKNMLKLKPKLEEWLISTHQLFQQGYTALEINENHLHNRFPKPSIAEQEAKQLAEIKKVKRQYITDSSRKRRKRTNLVPEQRNSLYKRYLQNNRPSEEALKEIADDIGLDVNVVKIWFCNRRQKDRKCVKKDDA